jgi:hypothetical protein
VVPSSACVGGPTLVAPDRLDRKLSKENYKLPLS